MKTLVLLARLAQQTLEMVVEPVWCMFVEAVVVIASVVARAVDIESERTYPQVYMMCMVLEEVVVLDTQLVMVDPYFVLDTPVVMFASPERRLAPSIHSLHDRDRWHRGYVLVGWAAEILTWAERGRPLSE